MGRKRQKYACGAGARRKLGRRCAPNPCGLSPHGLRLRRRPRYRKRRILFDPPEGISLASDLWGQPGSGSLPSRHGCAAFGATPYPEGAQPQAVPRAAPFTSVTTLRPRRGLAILLGRRKGCAQRKGLSLRRSLPTAILGVSRGMVSGTALARPGFRCKRHSNGG